MLTLGDSYQVRGRGGDGEKLRLWLGDMDFQNGWWQGELDRDLTEFVATVSAMDGEILQANRQRQSLEAFFMNQLRRANVVPS